MVGKSSSETPRTNCNSSTTPKSTDFDTRWEPLNLFILSKRKIQEIKFKNVKKTYGSTRLLAREAMLIGIDGLLWIEAFRFPKLLLLVSDHFDMLESELILYFVRWSKSPRQEIVFEVQILNPPAIFVRSGRGSAWLRDSAKAIFSVPIGTNFPSWAIFSFSFFRLNFKVQLWVRLKSTGGLQSDRKLSSIFAFVPIIRVAKLGIGVKING